MPYSCPPPACTDYQQPFSPLKQYLLISLSGAVILFPRLMPRGKAMSDLQIAQNTASHYSQRSRLSFCCQNTTESNQRNTEHFINSGNIWRRTFFISNLKDGWRNKIVLNGRLMACNQHRDHPFIRNQLFLCCSVFVAWKVWKTVLINTSYIMEILTL